MPRGRAGAAAPRPRRPLRRHRDPARPSASSCPICAATRRSPTWRPVRERALRQPRRRRRRSSARCCSSTSTSTTRRCSRRSSSPSPASTRPSASGPRARPRPGSVVVEARPVEIGFEGDGFAYDNERPRHRVELRRLPDRPRAGDQRAVPRVRRGRRLPRAASCGRRRAGPSASARAGSVRSTGPPTASERRFDRVEPLARELPVMHVSAFEADAYARWRGARLPTEAEWEHAAALFEPERGELDQLGFGPGPAGPFVGDCWEWTASEFERLPGLRGLPVPRVLGGLLRRGLPRAARRRLGDPRPGRAPDASATGTTRSGGRSSPGSAVRRTSA